MGAVNRIVGAAREVLKRHTRSPKWAALERAHLAQHGRCAACGGKRSLQVHHVKPFHLQPDLELEPTNLITLCMSGPECHLRIGHGGNWKTYSPTVVGDAADLLSTIGMFEARARAGRLK